ncbi:MAG: hypothetical protein VYA31_03105 [Gemmatimonadota bacterium]|nr:hypothetical protein [Gemmatimonadota bacterium]
MRHPTCKLVSELIRDTNPRNHRRVKAIVGLRLLEVVRDRDLPTELLEEEDPARTIPRRLGLSDVVDRQIRTYGDDVQKGVHLTDQGITDLFTLVNRRSDSDEVFLNTGRELVEVHFPFRWGRVFPESIQYMFARTYLSWHLKHLFGRHILTFAEGPLNVEVQGLFFEGGDPEGSTCYLISGICQRILEQIGHRSAKVGHTLCQARGDDRCRWDGSIIPLTEE